MCMIVFSVFVLLKRGKELSLNFSLCVLSLKYLSCCRDVDNILKI